LKWNKLNPPIQSGKGFPLKDTQRIRAPPKGYKKPLGGIISAFSGALFSLVLLKVCILKINIKNFGNCYDLGCHKINKSQDGIIR
jgi:hypothetical protein